MTSFSGIYVNGTTTCTLAGVDLVLAPEWMELTQTYISFIIVSDEHGEPHDR